VGGFTITGGMGGLMRKSCKECGSDLERDPVTGNYRCVKLGCGKTLPQETETSANGAKKAGV
jgi:hypothetical protein